MEVRRIKPEEKIMQSLMCSVVFLDSLSDEYVEHLYNPLQHSNGYENVWGAFDDTGRMCSSMVSHDYNIHFDGHTVGMGGIGGVATLPECRKGGYIRAIFAKALPDMKEKGKVFSFLYPFSFAFYRKFGYELCYTPNSIIMPTSFFKSYPFPDGVEMHMPGGDVSGFMAVYDAFSRDRNLSFARDTAAWDYILRDDPYVTRNYAYLHRDSQGRPDAYLLFKVDENHGNEGNTLRVKDMGWTGITALHAMLGFIGGLEPQFAKLAWDAPRGLNIRALFPESYEISVSSPASGMLRVVDVPKALALLRPPSGAGRAVVGVTDVMLPSNTGRYALEWEAGQMTAQPVSSAAHLETDVETLAQLVSGYLTVDEARCRRGVAVNGNEAQLRALFPHKDMYVTERF